MGRKEASQTFGRQESHNIMDKQLVSISKILSYALRHKPEEFNIKLDKEGWIDIDILCKAIACCKSKMHISKETIEKIIAESEKKRFEISGNKVRATYGHSFSAKIEFKESVPPNILFHGTSHDAYKKICKEGLKPMNRQYVHLSTDADTAKKVGIRHDKNPVILVVDAPKMYSDGMKFFHSANDGTWLCDCVPSKYIVKIIKDL